MPQVYTGTQYAEITAKGFINGTVGAFTMIAIFKRSANSGGGDKYCLSLCDTGGTNQLAGLRFSGTDLLGYDAGGGQSAASTLSVTTSDGWVAIGVTKAAGAVKARFHKYVYSTSTASHEDSVGNSANFTGAGTGTSFVVCRVRNNLTSFNALGSMAAAATYPKQMSDQEFESAATSLMGMMAQDPSYGLITFDAETVRVIDPVGGAAQTTNTGAVDSTGSPFSYAFPISDNEVPLSFPQTLSPTAIDSLEAFGTPVIGGSVTLSPSSIVTAEAFGTAVVGGSIMVSPTGIATAESFGTPAISASITLSPTAIATAESFGTPTLTGSTTVSPSSIVSGESFGTAVITAGPITVSPVALESLESVGSPVLEKIQFFDGPTYGEPFGRDWLWRNMRFDVGKCVLIYGSDVLVVNYPTDEQIVAADTVLRGGMTHTITPEVADILIIAGLGAYIHGAGGAPSPVVEATGDGGGGNPYDDVILADSPLVYLTLDESGLPQDSSGHGFHAAYAEGAPGAPLFSGSSASRVVDGTTSIYPFDVYGYGDLGTASGISAEVWISQTGGQASIFAYDVNDSDNFQFQVNLYDAPIGTDLFVQLPVNQEAAYLDLPSLNLLDGVTHHIVGTWDGATLSLYVDGAFVDSVAGLLSGSMEVQKVYGSADSSTSTFDSFALYGTALSDERILAHYNAGVA
jgi:hypothetical protein